MITFEEEMDKIDKEEEKVANNIRECPDIIGGKSLMNFLSYMTGYATCLSEPVYEKFREQRKEPKEVKACDLKPTFQDYVRNHYDLHFNDNAFQHWSGIIQFFSKTDEDAFDTYFKLLDEFEEFVESGGKIERTDDGWVVVKNDAE